MLAPRMTGGQELIGYLRSMSQTHRDSVAASLDPSLHRGSISNEYDAKIQAYAVLPTQDTQRPSIQSCGLLSPTMRTRAIQVLTACVRPRGAR